MTDKKVNIDFEEYIRQGEPDKRERAYIWRTAIGLQAVDGLETSDYLKGTARRNIEGEITIDEAQQIVKTYYEKKHVSLAVDDDMEEADRVSANIAKVLSQSTMAFNSHGFVSLHRRIFEGVFKHAGQLRTYDITKKEWVLRGDTVNYLNWEDLRRAIDYDLSQEKEFDYTQLSKDDFIRHISHFVAGLWQIHPFGEGNTRTTAVFIIKYLRTLGFDVDNDLFARHSWYFRNALVRANYSNYKLKISRNPSFLEMFFRNLLLGENNELKNRFMLINPPEEWNVPPTSTPTSTPTSMESGFSLPNNPLILNLIRVIGVGYYSIKEMMAAIGLKDRKNFMEYHLSPAMAEGYVKMMYPDKPRHPRQKYLLTPKGLLLYHQTIGQKD